MTTMEEVIAQEANQILTILTPFLRDREIEEAIERVKASARNILKTLAEGDPD